MNGELERLVYNGVMDIATYNWWLNFLNKLGELSWYFVIPFVVSLTVLITYQLFKKIETDVWLKEDR
jgi:hypothetical protein